MKILVTGGAGFIGSNIVDKYVKLGHDVVILDNFSTGKKGNCNSAARFYYCDIRDSMLVDGIIEFEKPDIINHHAAQISVPESVKNSDLDFEINFIGTQNILKAMKHYGTRKIIFASSGGAIYGEAEEYPTTEKCMPDPMSPYANHKLMAEGAIEAATLEHGINYTILRYSNIYGPRQTKNGEAGVVAIFIEKLLNRKQITLNHFETEPLGMIRDYCYVKDVVQANVLALNGGKNEVYNIGTGVGSYTHILFLLICESLQLNTGKDYNLLPLNSAPPREGDIKRSCLDCKKAWNELGWYPKISLVDGIEKTVEWWIKSMTSY